MTRYHYIKKCMYLQYRLAMLPTTTNRHYITSYAKWNSLVPYPPFANGAKTYQESWDMICANLRSIECLRDLE